MESNSDVVDALREADRAEAAPFIDYPPTPGWYPPAMGLWAAAFCWTVSVPEAPGLRVALLVVLIAVQFAFVGWYRSYRGVWPRGRAPQEIRSVMRHFIIGAALVVIGVGMILAFATGWIAAGVAFVVVTPAVVWYERAYARAAARARARLG